MASSFGFSLAHGIIFAQLLDGLVVEAGFGKNLIRVFADTRRVSAQGSRGFAIADRMPEHSGPATARVLCLEDNAIVSSLGIIEKFRDGLNGCHGRAELAGSLDEVGCRPLRQFAFAEFEEFVGVGDSADERLEFRSFEQVFAIDRATEAFELVVLNSLAPR